MSGDVQPRKRKDKRRKKDEAPGPEEPIVQAAASPIIEDFNIIHVHNDHGTGGGICAKLVFFVLLSILAVLIGMILVEKRGLTDLETAPSESRFAEIFEGWIDESVGHHEEDHAHDELIEHDDHDEHEEHEASEEASVEHDEEHDEHEEEHLSEEQVSQEAVTEEELEEAEDELDDTEEQAASQEEEEEQVVSQEEEEQQEDAEDEQEGSEEKQEDDEEIQTLIDDDNTGEDVQASNEDEAGDNDDDNEAADTNEDNDEKDDNDNTAEEEDNLSNREDDIFEEDATDNFSEENDIVEEDSAENTADDVEGDDQEEEEVVDNTAGEEDALKEEAEKKEEIEVEESSSRIRVLPDEESEESDDDPWTKKSTVPADLQQKLKLAEANLRDLQNPDLAHKLFTNLMEQLPSNNRIKYGLAQSLDQLAELRRSNQLLQDAISSYYDILQSSTISDKLYLKVAERCIDRIRFRGHYGRAVQLHKAIINRFPNNSSHRNQLAVTLLTSNRLAEAKTVLEEVLAKWPNDGFALAHYGFILKTKDNNMHEAVKYLRRGIESRMPGVIDGRFYFHLGDALQRLGKNDEAMLVYEDGVKHNVFLSKYQRSLYNVDRLTGIPWWPINQTPYASFFKLLEEKWKTIREEGLVLLSKAGFFKDEAENLRDTGQWKQFELFARGHKFVENCKKCPQTCRLIENFPDAKSCKRGQVKFSVMHPGTHVWPHCGPSNCRLRAHLGLKVPPGTFIRVADETRSWSEGKVFIFDDSFEHEVWHNGSEVRLVLIVDVWHPELTEYEKRSLPAI